MNQNQGRGHSGRKQKVTKVVAKETTNSPTAKRIIVEDLERSSKKQRSPVNKSPNPQPPSELASNFQPRPFSFHGSLNPQNVHIQVEQNTELLNNNQPTNNSQRKPHKKKVHRKPKQKQNNLPENQAAQDRRETDRVISEKSQFSLPQTSSENNYSSERKNSKPLPIPLDESQIPTNPMYIYPSQPQLFAEQTPNTTLQQMPVHTPISVLQQQALVTPPSPMNVETRPSTLQHTFLSPPLFTPPQSVVSTNEKATPTTTTVLNLPQSPVTPPSPMNVETRPELLKLPPPQPIFTPNFQIQQFPMNFPNTRPMQQFIPKPPWFGIKVNSLYPVNTLHTEILQFCQYIKSTSVEATLREKVIQRLGDVISNIWPNVQMKTFGSFETKLYLPTSDIDCTLCGQFQLPSDLYYLSNVIHNSNLSHAQNVQPIATAKVPIIKYVDLVTSINVDISFNTNNGVQNSQVVKALLQEYEVLESLVLVLKYFLSKQQLNETYSGGIGSYTLVIMVASYLENNVAAKNAQFLIQKCDLGKLLIGFFHLFGKEFNYDTTAINAQKQFYTKPESLISQQMQLNIEDPHDPVENDVGKGSFRISTIRKIFENSHDLLVHGSAQINTASKLTRIFDSNQELIDWRNHYVKIYNKLAKDQVL